MDKLLKMIEGLKMPTSFSNSDANIPGTISSAVVAASDAVKTKKKERMNHCRAVADAVCNPSVQGLTDYNKILESVVEVLFQLCNDPDPDIRLVASDCLNRIARVLKESYQPKFHMELYREIRKNQSPRSLRTALNIFAFISPTIRPQKCRAFLSSLLPCLAQISKRTEELLYENISSPIRQIFKVLGPFAHDSEIKILCKDFTSNLESNSSIVRRSSASILVAICNYSKNAWDSLPKLLAKVIELLIPNLMEKSISAIIGVMQCVRQCIPCIYDQIRNGHFRTMPANLESVTANLVQVYEMCMILCNHDDHNVITTSLETLQQLFSSPVESFISKITSPTGIENSLDDRCWNILVSSTPVTSSSENLFFTDETSNLLESDLDVPKFRSLISSDTSDGGRADSERSIILSSNRRSSDLFIIEGSISDAPSLVDSFQNSDDDDSHSVLTATEQNLVMQTFPEIQIGSLYEKNIPIYYCARFLAYNFLLSGQKGIIKPDGEIRISAKVLGTNCISNLISIRPEILNLSLSYDLVDTGEDTDCPTVDDLLIYATHEDPLLRGTVYILIGTYIKSVLLKCTTSVHEELQHKLREYIQIVQNGLKGSSNVGVKCAISSLTSCINVVLSSQYFYDVGINLLECVLMTVNNPYWLVKIDLCELLSSIEWGIISGLDDLRDSALAVLIDFFLSDEDNRVRVSSVAAIIKIAQKSSVRDYESWESYQIFCKECVANDVNVQRGYNLNVQVCSKCSYPCPRPFLKILQRIVNKILRNLRKLEDKYSVAGNYLALAQISETFEPKIYPQVWGCVDRSNTSLMLSTCVDSLRTSPIVYELSVHQSILVTTGNLFMASKFFKVGSETTIDDSNPFSSQNVQISNYGIQLLQHCLAVIRMYRSVIESANFTSSLRKQSSSPVISPAKRFSQKLEAENKAQESDKISKGLSFCDTVCQEHFKKMHDSVMMSWKNFKSSLDPAFTTKFTSLLVAAVHTLKKLFSCIRPDFPGMTALIDEILGSFNVLFYLCPAPIMQNILQMLKCIFSLYEPSLMAGNQIERIETKSDLGDFIEFLELYEDIIAENRSNDNKKAPPDKSTLGSYIRQFESAVVTALRMYTTSSNPEVQCEVLRLLVQLIKGHVNYGLVDSSQVFLGFVTKQVSCLEEGHGRCPNFFAREIFQFLIILTHEHNSSKKFLDLPKILKLCDDLVSAAEKSAGLVPIVATGLKCVVSDLFILRGMMNITNQEKIEYESFKDQVLEMVKKLCGHPEILPVLWLSLKGRKMDNKAKWMIDLEFFGNEIILRLENEELSSAITTMQEFNNLAAFLYSLDVVVLPTYEKLVAILLHQFNKNIQNQLEFSNSCVTINSFWLLLTLQARKSEDDTIEGDVFRLFLNFLKKHLTNLSSIILEDLKVKFLVNQVGVFMKISSYLFKTESREILRQDLLSQENIEALLQIAKKCVELSVVDFRLRIWLVEILSSSHYPIIAVWEIILKKSRIFIGPPLTQCIIKIVKDLNDSDVPNLEEWVIVNYSNILLDHISHSEVTLFIRRLSTYRLEQILDQITILLESTVDSRFAKNILLYLERVSDSFLCETTIAGVKLLKKSDVTYFTMEVSHFLCSSLTLIHTRKLLFSNKDREFLREYFSDSCLINRYPRLVTILRKVLFDSQPYSTSPIFKLTRDDSALVYQWCTEDINEMEGSALTKMLSCLKYSQVSAILNSPNYNMCLMQHCFRYIEQAYRSGSMPLVDVMDLFTSQKRSSLIEKWPLAVAAVEFIVDTLDSWESLFLESKKKNGPSLVEYLSLRKNISFMWAALTEMLTLKNSVLRFDGNEHKECCNNFIPTGIFTLSFEFMADSCTTDGVNFEDLRVFLKFAAIAVCDSSFLSFFDARENYKSIFVCVLSLGKIVRKLICDLKITYNFNRIESEVCDGMNEECVMILSELYHLMNFIEFIRERKIVLNKDLYLGFRSVVSGLGRCELLNGWILIFHLGWRPQELSKTHIFPVIQEIPLDILRNEVDMLLKYIAKLNLLGVASKIQFEENWVVFLSVINLYVDETFQLSIVTTGLRALSMMLQQTVKIIYSFKGGSEALQQAVEKIDIALAGVEPKLCQSIHVPHLASISTKKLENRHNVDVNSCIRFLTDLYTQWLQNPQGKMPLFLLSEVIQSIIVMAEYFEDVSQHAWMYETLLEISKSFDKEDGILWSHLNYGIFYSAAKLSLTTEAITNLSQILETSLNSYAANISNVHLDCALVYLQHHPDCTSIINTVLPYVLQYSKLDEMANDSETHCLKVWMLILFIWIHGPLDRLSSSDFEQETLRNILTVLSPLNKVYVSVRLLVLKGLRLKIQMGEIKSDVRKTITKVTLETLSTPNSCIFYQTLKLYLTIFYYDFGDCLDKSDLDPEILMLMAERSDVLFQQLRAKTKCRNQIASKVLPLIIADFLPPSEILNRVIAEFLSPLQTQPELVAPTLAQVFEKAKRRTKEAALVKEWILASLPNFVATANVDRAIWSLTLFFIGVSSSPKISFLLPFAQLRRRSPQVKALFVHCASDFYLSLDEKKKINFRKIMNDGPFNSEEKKPYAFLAPVLDKVDMERDQWAFDRTGDS